MTAIVTHPPFVMQGPDSVGAKKIPAKADPKLHLEETSVDKKVLTEQTQASTIQSGLPRSHIQQSPNGRTILVQLNEAGGETKNTMPLRPSETTQEQAAVTALKTVKNPYIKTV